MLARRLRGGHSRSGDWDLEAATAVLNRHGMLPVLAVVVILFAGMAMLQGGSHVHESLHSGNGHRHLGFHHPQQTMASGEELAMQGDRLAWEEEAIRAAVMAEEEEEVEVEGEEEAGEARGVLTETVATDAEPSPARKYGNRLDIDNMPEPEQGSPDWAAYHEEMRLRKHEQNKRRRQIEKAAIGATIAAAKVSAVTEHLKGGGMAGIAANIKNLHGTYKFTGSGALGGKEARLAAAAYLNATKVSTLAELERTVQKLAAEGQLSADVPNMGPADKGFAVDDDSSCKGACGRMGWCQNDQCVCAAMYTGERCETPREMPAGMHAAFSGNFVFNRNRIAQLPDLLLKYTTNPKASGGFHSFAVPVTRDMLAYAPAQDPLARRLYRSCAIVGSSGVLNHYHFGPTIDASNLVIRFNLAPTAGYIDQVGSKTTLRFVNTVHAGYHEGDEVGVMQMQSQVGLQLYLKFRREHPAERILAFDTDFSKFVSSNVATLPTGGYFAVWLALARCAKVTVYGFNFASGYGVPHHYFNGEKPKKGSRAIHDYDLEHKMISALAAAGHLQFAEPCVAGCPQHTGISYSTLVYGADCQCGTGNPLPVAQPGFCRVPGSFQCFFRCPGGQAQCPGGLQLHAEEGQPHKQPADGEHGDCPPEVLSEEWSEQPLLYLDPQGIAVPLQCSTAEDGGGGGGAGGEGVAR